MNSRSQLWTGRILTGLALAFLLMDAIMKIVKAGPAIQGSAELGYAESVVAGIGWTLLACTVLYAIPRTAAWGALLLTAYLGGAVASQVRVGNPLFTHVLFPVYFGVLLWTGLVLRDRRVRGVLVSNTHREVTP